MDNSNNRKLAGAAIIVMISTILSRITGYLREMLISNRLGVGDVGDAYNVAFNIPDLMYYMILGGSIAAALIPVLSGYIEKKDEEEGWKAIGTFINVSFLAMVIFCILGMIFTNELISLLAQGFKQKNEATQLLAVKLTRILFPSVSFLMLAGLCNGVLNSYHRFTAAAFGPVIYNLGGVLSLLVFGSNTPRGAERVAYGVMASAFVYFVFQAAIAFKNLKYYRFSIHLSHPGFRRLFKLALPSLVSSSVVQVNVMISTWFATFAAAGSLTLYNNANRTWQLPLGIFAQSMGVTLLPTLSANAAVGNYKDYKGILMKGIKMVLIFSIPSAVALIVLREPIIRTLFKFSSKFTEESVAKTSFILVFFSLGLVAQSIVAIMTRAFYAVNDTKTPLFLGSSTIVINFVLSYIFFNMTALSVAGMALAYSVSSMFYAITLMIILNKRISGLEAGNMAYFLIKILLSAAVMGLVLYPLNRVLPVDINSKISQVLFLGFETAAGALVFFALVLITRVDVGLYVLNILKNKIKR
ncbi:MAG: murein biosynthesis integral membrane protein MurJ [Clostridia bacterium]|nr:murein biosynthesis integral membrane protein MurJ [Clostridia bacterium]